MPQSQFDSFPVTSFQDLEDNFSKFLEYMRFDFNNTYGIGSDVTGTLDVANNLKATIVDSETDITITGEWTFDTHPLGLLHSLIGDLDWVSSGHPLTDFIAGDGLIGGGTIESDRTFNVGAGTAITVNADDVAVDVTALEPLIDHSDIDELEWSVAGHIIDTDIDMNNNSLSELNNITFNDGELLGSDGSVLELDLTGSITDFNIKTSGNFNSLYVDESTGSTGLFGTPDPNNFGTTVDIPYPIDVRGYLKVGADLNNFGGVRTVNNIKDGGLALPSYLYDDSIDDSDFTLLRGTVRNSSSTASFGGGAGFQNAMTQLHFYVAVDNATRTGNILFQIDGISNTTTFQAHGNNHNVVFDSDTVTGMIIVDSASNSLQFLTDISASFGTGGRSLVVNDGVNLILQSDAVGTGAVKTTAGRIVNTTRLTSGDSPYTVLATDHIIICDTDGGAIEVDLTSGVEGKEYRISNVGSSGNDVTVDPNGTEQVFSGGAGVAFVMTDTEGITINFNVTEGWW